MFRDWPADIQALRINKAVCQNSDDITFMVDFEFKRLPDAETTIVSICVPGN